MTNIWKRIRGTNRPDLTCRELVELVTDYLEGGLTEGERKRFEAHVSECTGCDNYIDQMQMTVQLAGRLREDELPAEVEAALIRAFRGVQNSPG